jgi:hypothetical protein
VIPPFASPKNSRSLPSPTPSSSLTKSVHGLRAGRRDVGVCAPALLPPSGAGDEGASGADTSAVSDVGASGGTGVPFPLGVACPSRFSFAFSFFAVAFALSVGGGDSAPPFVAGAGAGAGEALGAGAGVPPRAGEYGAGDAGLGAGVEDLGARCGGRAFSGAVSASVGAVALPSVLVAVRRYA